MHRSGTSIASILSTSFVLLVGLGLDSDAAAKDRSKSARAVEVRDVIELELRETLEGKLAPDARELIVPVHGQLTGWVELFGESRRCRVESSPTREEQLELELDCQVFEVRVERALNIGEPTLLGEIEGREGQRLRVVATRR